MTSSDHGLSRLRKGVAAYHRASPSVASAFTALHDAALESGALGRDAKELMAVVIAIVTHCDGCIEWHLHAAAGAGATREMALEAVDVAVVMGGGPAVLSAGDVLRLIEEVFPS